MNKKQSLPQEISTEDLLKSLKGHDLINEKVSFSFNDPILSFVQAFKLTQGTKLVADKVLYRLYRIWNKDCAIQIKSFNYQLATYVPSVRTNRLYFKVDQNVLDIVKKTQELEDKRSQDKSRSEKWNKHFEAFLDYSGLESGSVYIECDILYYLYNNWLDLTHRNSKLSYENFLEICELNFDKKRLSDSNIRWFGVNTKIKRLITKEEVTRWRQGRKKYGKRHKEDPSKKETTYTDPKRETEKVLYYKKSKVKKK